MVTENQIKQHASVLRALAATPIQQRQLISSFEWLCGTRHPSKVPSSRAAIIIIPTVTTIITIVGIIIIIIIIIITIIIINR